MALYYSDGPRFVACSVAPDTAVLIDTDKIKSKSCRVLYECDIDGVRVKS
jgi:hypothetical protein